jgi:hypothetical protein
MVTVRTIESLLVLSSIEVAGTNLYRTAVINSASGKIVAAARAIPRDLIAYDDTGLQHEVGRAEFWAQSQ